jgi:hypothetical protein
VVKLTVRATGARKQQLERLGTTTVRARVTFSPTGGSPKTKTKKITLVKRG